MPPWVARQCYVWRAPHSVPGAWRIATASSRHPRCFITVRSYAQSSNQDGQHKLSTANSAIIIPRSVNAQPDDLIAHIQPIERARLTRDRFAVFFVTPAFAPWLLDDQTFLRKALRQAYAHMLDWDGFPYARIHALCAVVDKLPVPKAIGERGNIEIEALERVIQPPVLEDGYEGIAYTTLRFDDSIPASSPAGEDEHAAISFIKSGRADALGHFGDAVRLPLANTVFQTGSPSTMTYSTWIKRKGQSDFELKEKNNVTQHGIKLYRGGPSQQCISTLAVPLVPLTEPRRVDASMGNILRRVVGADGKSATASQELETIVPRYYKARGETSQATLVWALLIPKELVVPVSHKTNSLLGRQSDDDSTAAAGDDALWEALWKRDPGHWNDLVPTALASSARLHRVLSGGGGWGKKAGLLSLDPIATAGDAMSPPAGLSSEPNDLNSALQQVSHDGDYIQFFISPSATSPEPSDSEAQSNKLEALTKVSTPWGWELGTVPSTMDTIPGGSWQHASPASKDAFVFKHSFGALAEGGLTLHRQFRLKTGDAFSLISGSKVDVPYSRFSAVTIGAEEEGVEEDSMQNFLEAKPIPHHNVLVRRLFSEGAPPFLGLGRLKTADRWRPDSLRFDPPPEDEALEPIRKFSVYRGDPITPKLGQEPPQTSKELKSVVRKIPVIDGPERPPKLFRYTMRTNEVDYCADKMRQGSKAVQRLTDEYRITMNGIMRTSKRPMDLTVKRLGDNVSKATKVQITESCAYINMIAMEAEASDVKLYRLRDTFSNTLKGATQNDFDQLLTRIQQTTLTIAGLRNELTHILNFVSLRARLTHHTNNSAVTLYQLNIALRWRLGTMILTRQRFQHPHPMTHSLPHLEEKLVKLRAYGSGLFHDRKGMSVPYVRRRLIEMEGQKMLLRNLKLSKPVERRKRIAALSVVQQIDHDKNADPRRAMEKNDLSANGKIRRVFDAVRVRPVPTDKLPQAMVADIQALSAEKRTSQARGGLALKQHTMQSESELVTSHEQGKPLDDGVIRRFVGPSRRERIQTEVMLKRRQTEKKRKAKGELVGTVLGWLDGGGVEIGDGGGEVERVFGEKARDSDPMPRTDVDGGDEGGDLELAPEVHREGGYVFGGQAENAPSDGPYRGDVDDHPKDRSSRARSDLSSTDGLPPPDDDDPFIFLNNDEDPRRQRNR